jgi:hypothetical protein
MEEEKKEEVKQEGDFKIKKKPKKFHSNKQETKKIDLKKVKEEKVELSKQEPNAISESSTVHVDEDKQTENVQKVESGASESGLQESPVQEEESKQEENGSPIQEITEIVETPPVVTTTSKEIPQSKLPEGVEKLVSFMKETGGNVQDFVRLNADYTSIDENTLLKEYYKNSKPHLDTDEIDFIMEENFNVDEEYDEEREVRRKKLAKKEEVAKARKFLEDLKSQYYEEIKLRPTVNNEMTKANEFFNRFKEQQEIAKQQHANFKDETSKFFNDEFKGFDFKLGEKQFRYSINNASDVASTQSDISNVVKKFLNDKGEVIDVQGYHKAMYTAQNADTIAQHFYEQGKADAVKNVVAQSKNINNDARQTKAPDDIYLNGLKVKAISGINSAKLKIKKK